jgi:hypothetical protein
MNRGYSSSGSLEIFAAASSLVHFFVRALKTKSFLPSAHERYGQESTGIAIAFLI